MIYMTPEQKLASVESNARFKILVTAIICAAASLLEFLLVVFLPLDGSIGYDNLLGFSAGMEVIGGGRMPKQKNVLLLCFCLAYECG